jgi:hypothetical protein
MRKLSILITVLLITSSCNRLKEPGLSIKTDYDTVKYGDIFHAELYVPYHDNYLPAFYIVRKEDTSRLPIDTIKRCAIFNAVGRGNGEKSYNGYVEYIDLLGKKKTEKFSLKYYVIE